MEKQYMTHEEVNKLLKDGWDMPRGWVKEEFWHKKVCSLWRNMWQRCYDPNNSSYIYYINSIIHDDFRVFSNYLEWIMKQPRFDEFCSTCHNIRWTIDKDMKVKGNIHYLPEYMLLCTQSENSKASNLPKPIIGIKDDTQLIINSINEARDYGFDPGTITKCCKGKYDHKYKGYKWYYLDEKGTD